MIARSICSIVFSFAMVGAVNADWVDGRGGSCKSACAAAGSAPVSSGTYKNGNPFYICAANAHGEGFRAGYNLEPSWSRACVVGWGGKEEGINPFQCLCQVRPLN